MHARDACLSYLVVHTFSFIHSLILSIYLSHFLSLTQFIAPSQTKRIFPPLHTHTHTHTHSLSSQRRNVVHWAPWIDPETDQQIVLQSANALHSFMRTHKFKKQRNQCGPASRDLNTIYYRWRCADPLHGDCPALVRSLTSKNLLPKSYTLEYATSHAHNAPSSVDHGAEDVPMEETGHVFRRFPLDLQESIDEGLRQGKRPKHIYMELTSEESLSKRGWRQALDTEKLVGFSIYAHCTPCFI
jgi:hypothetical protein